MNDGLVKVRGVGQALVSAAAQDVTVFVDVKPFPHPGRIVLTACTYKIANDGGAVRFAAVAVGLGLGGDEGGE